MGRSKLPTFETKFYALDLNEANVQAIFNRCGKKNEDGSTAWNEEALKKNQANIRYLLGQLSLVHDGAKKHELDSAFFKKYDGGFWTSDINLVISLLNMAIQCNLCFLLSQNSIDYCGNPRPTLSPKDPKFAAWWEGTDGLMIQAEAAEDEYKRGKAFSFYEKAAKLGDAEAQFNTGCFYAFGYDEEIMKDTQAAFHWFQLSAKQGYGKAQKLLDLMSKKPLLGGTIVDLELAISNLLDHYADIDSDINLLLIDKRLYMLYPHALRIKYDNKVYEAALGKEWL